MQSEIDIDREIKCVGRHGGKEDGKKILARNNKWKKRE